MKVFLTITEDLPIREQIFERLKGELQQYRKNHTLQRILILTVNPAKRTKKCLYWQYWQALALRWAGHAYTISDSWQQPLHISLPEIINTFSLGTRWLHTSINENGIYIGCFISIAISSIDLLQPYSRRYNDAFVVKSLKVDILTDIACEANAHQIIHELRWECLFLQR